MFLKLRCKRIKDLRLDHHYKQRTLATVLGVSQATYAKYEKGEINLDADTIVKLARYYHVSADYLLGLTKEKGKED